MDIDKKLKWKYNDSLLKIPHINDSIIVTNPPYFTNYSATRKKLFFQLKPYFEKTIYNDIYLIALDKMLEASDYVVAIVPETFINSNYQQKNRLSSITILEDNPFDDTDVPVVIACFDKRIKNLKEVKVYKNNEFINSLGNIETMRLIPNKNIKMRFNDLSGWLGIRCVDTTDPHNMLRFDFKEKIDYNWDRGIKISSRLFTLVNIDVPFGKRENFVNECNNILNSTREKTSDIIFSPEKKKFDLLHAEYIQKCIVDVDTFLTARLIKQAFSEAYGAVQSAKSNAENRKDKKYFRPTFNGKKMVLSECSQEFGSARTTLFFDYNITLKCLRTDKGRGYKISIPLKKHVQFNKWNNLGRAAKSVTITDKYVMFSFEIETGEKKQDGAMVGFDFGMKRLGTLSNGNIIGEDIEKLLYELQGKKRCSKSYYRKKEEIKEYINREIKDINFDKVKLITVEKLKNMKYKMKERGRLSKNIRSVFYNLSYRQVLSRIQMLSEENRVTFRRVLPFNTSLECSHCGHIEKGNRLSQELFVCQKCGYTDNADYNASKVILKRFTTGTYGSCYKQEYLEKYDKSQVSIGI